MCLKKNSARLNRKSIQVGSFFIYMFELGKGCCTFVVDVYFQCLYKKKKKKNIR